MPAHGDCVERMGPDKLGGTMHVRALLCIALTAGLLAVPVAPAAADSGIPSGTVLLPQHLDLTQDEIDTNWHADRQAPSAGWNSTSFDGRDDLLEYRIDDSSADSSTFRRTEGLKTIHDVGVSVETSLFMDPSWADQPVRAGLWTVGEDSSGGRSDAYAIIEFSTARDWESPATVENNEGWRVWVSGLGWENLDTSVTYGEWVDLRIDLDVAAQEYRLSIDGNLVKTHAIDVSDPFIRESLFLREVFLNSYNYGLETTATGFDSDDYAVRWDGLDYVLAFSDIQPAINAASAGDTVLVGPGTFVGALNIPNKPGLSLVGSGADQTTIDADGALTRGITAEYSATAGGSDLRLEGFTLVGSQKWGLKLAFIEGLQVTDVQATGNGSSGVDLNTVKDVEVAGLVAKDNGGNGLSIRNASGVLVDGADVSGNAWGGIAFYAPGTEAVSDVSIVGSSLSDHETAAIYFQYEGADKYTDIQIGEFGAGNTISDNEVGILVQDHPSLGQPDASGITLRGNYIASNTVGAANEGVGTLDARGNYWGSPGGPVVLGDSVEGDVEVLPWCALSSCHLAELLV